MTKFHQAGRGKGKKILIVGESPSPRGWKDGKLACRNKKGNLLPTGKRLNELLKPFGVSVDECGFTELSKRYLNHRGLFRPHARASWSVFLKQLRGRQYKLIVLLGVETAKIFSELCGCALTVGEISETKLGAKKYAVLPIYHPSPRNPKNRDKNRQIISNHLRAIRVLIK